MGSCSQIRAASGSLVRAVFIQKNASEQIFVGHNDVVGNDFVDVRIYRVQGCHRFPTKRGVMVPVAALPALIEALSDMLAAADRGLRG